MFGFMKKALGFYEKNYAPKIVEVIKNQGYSYKKFKTDASAGLTVSVISIPLSMALAIASGVSPAQGLYTAIVAGFFIALLAGGRYQIGGPTGAFAIVLEMLPEEAANYITQRLNIPTIGIGAGKYCDGQVLVCDDILGKFSEFKPKFARRYANFQEEIIKAAKDYISDVKTAAFPDDAESFHLNEEEIKKLESNK